MGLAVKILVADDHALFREGLRHVLAQLDDAVEVVEAGDCEQTLCRVEAHPDLALVLLDLDMPGPDGFAALDTLTRRHSALPIVVLSASRERADMRRALESGALGFIPKSATAPVMLSALRLVLAGGVYVPPELMQGPGGVPKGRSVELTPRQLDVLALVIEGKPNKLIADELGLTLATVKAHVTAVLKSLHVSNRTQAARAAERLGLLDERG